MTAVSCAFKNQWGCIPSTTRYRHHPHFNLAIVALNALIDPTIAIVDGKYCLDVHGPFRGIPVTLDTVLFGRLGECEVACCALLGFDSGSLPYLAIAKRLGRWHMELDPCSREALQHVGHKAHLRLKLVDNLARFAFSSSALTWLCYDSPVRPIFVKMARLLR